MNLHLNIKIDIITLFHKFINLFKENFNIIASAFFNFY